MMRIQPPEISIENQNEESKLEGNNVEPVVNNDLYGTLDVDNIARSPEQVIQNERLEFNTIVAMEDSAQRPVPNQEEEKEEEKEPETYP